MVEKEVKKVNTVSTISPTVAVPTHQETKRVNQNKIRKKCFGCDNNFTTTQQLDYDYCLNCAINDNRYIPGRFTKNKCSECGDGSGIIKFSNQPSRNCKTCHLIKLEILHQAKNQLPKLEAEAEKITQIRLRLESYD